MNIESIRRQYHKNICKHLLFADTYGVPNNADKHSQISVDLAKGILRHINLPTTKNKASGQTSGKAFELFTSLFLEKAFNEIKHLRPGKYHFLLGKSIEDYQQYEHLSTLNEILKQNKELRSTLGDYLISPDIVVSREPVNDKEINVVRAVVKDRKTSKYTPLRKINSKSAILHASVSCKWTIRSDRSQNARTEGLNLIRNRKGHTPHIVIVTAEPYPQRIASLAMGTGDIDCVYHFALTELVAAAKDLKNESVSEMMETLIDGKRLRDIADLPFDIAT